MFQVRVRAYVSGGYIQARTNLERVQPPRGKVSLTSETFPGETSALFRWGCLARRLADCERPQLVTRSHEPGSDR